MVLGEFTTHVRTYFSKDGDVHWGCDLGFDPWPFVATPYTKGASKVA